jgi:hypothetical protein
MRGHTVRGTSHHEHRYDVDDSLRAMAVAWTSHCCRRHPHESYPDTAPCTTLKCHRHPASSIQEVHRQTHKCRTPPPPHTHTPSLPYFAVLGHDLHGLPLTYLQEPYKMLQTTAFQPSTGHPKATFHCHMLVTSPCSPSPPPQQAHP